jgi:hypothetical protein
VAFVGPNEDLPLIITKLHILYIENILKYGLFKMCNIVYVKVAKSDTFYIKCINFNTNLLF